jgi:hypothetical protein
MARIAFPLRSRARARLTAPKAQASTTARQTPRAPHAAAARRSSRIGWRAVLLVLAALVSAPVFADSTVYLEVGWDEDEQDANRYGFALAYDLPYRFLEAGGFYLGSYFEVSASWWHADQGGLTGQDSLYEGGLTGVLRYQREVGRGFLTPFVELGTGPHLKSEREFVNKDFDLNFCFGSHLGAGLKFGEKGAYEVMYRFQHLSNADFGDDNPGIDFHLVRFGYRF